jgi:hypothetical protein
MILSPSGSAKNDILTGIFFIWANRKYIIIFRCQMGALSANALDGINLRAQKGGYIG